FEKLLTSQSRAMGLRYAHFLQPIPQIGKTLTDEESEFAKDAGVTAELYQGFIHDSERLRREGTPSVDLTGIFSQEKGTVYGDQIHCRRDSNGDSVGYSLMARRIADELGR